MSQREFGGRGTLLSSNPPNGVEKLKKSNMNNMILIRISRNKNLSTVSNFHVSSCSLIKIICSSVNITMFTDVRFLKSLHM